MSSRHIPLVSVVMSVYNGEQYLREAIDSILQQSFQAFEFIIINDGSTDSTEKILESYQDPRIQLISRANKGLVASLNEGIAKSRGKYIARMDADDIARPDRLKKQVEYLDTHANCSVVATNIETMNEHGGAAEPWFLDLTTLTPEAIFETMAHENCIAHPSVMMRAAIVKKLKYQPVHLAEDWDLWLRILQDGPVIHKIAEPLVQYRVHQASLVQSEQEPADKRVQRFLTSYLSRARKSGKLTKVDQLVAKNLLIRNVKKSLHISKGIMQKSLQKIGEAEISRVRAKKGNTKKHIVLIVPWLTVGGADQVVIDLANGLIKQYLVSVVTTETHPHEWRDKLDQRVKYYDAAKAGLVGARKTTKVVEYLYANHADVVIISNSLRGYRALEPAKRILPKLVAIDILHGQGGLIDRGGAPAFSRPYQSKIDHRVCVTEYLAKYMTAAYAEDPRRVSVIYNGIEPAPKLRRTRGHTLEIAWVGRMSAEKRPHLATQVFDKYHQLHPDSHLTIVGDGPLFDELKDQLHRHPDIQGKVTLTGAVENGRTYINKADILLVTSEMEGLPIVILEAIHAGVPVISTAVGGIPELIQDSRNGVLIKPGKDLIARFVESIQKAALWPPKTLVSCKSYDETLAQRLSTDTMIKDYEAVIEKQLAKKTHTR